MKKTNDHAEPTKVAKEKKENMPTKNPVIPPYTHHVISPIQLVLLIVLHDLIAQIGNITCKYLMIL